MRLCVDSGNRVLSRWVYVVCDKVTARWSMELLVISRSCDVAAPCLASSVCFVSLVN